MKTTLAILAHSGAQKTVDDFLPRWKSLDADLFCSLPVGDSIQGFDRHIYAGQSAYSGFHVFDRFLQTLWALIETQSDNLIIAEYDTVNLHPTLPKIRPVMITSYFVKADPPIGGGPMQLCALSPWCFDRESAWEFYHAAKESLEKDRDFDAGKGLLDRWIGSVVDQYNLPHVMGYDMLGYPWHDGAHDRIERMGFSWIHGWKNKEDFGRLWTRNG